MDNGGKGWISLERKLWDNPITTDMRLLGFWATLIYMANWKNSNGNLPRQKVVLRRGQICTSIKGLGIRTGLSAMVLRRYLIYLKNEGCISLNSTNQGTIITICKYSIFQRDHLREQQSKNKRITNQKQTDNNIITKKQGNKERKIPPKEDKDLAARWADHARSVSKTVKPDLEKWAVEIGWLKKELGISHEEMEKTLAFSKEDSFWKTNSASLMSLRKISKTNGLRKIENIRNAMNRPVLKLAEPPPKCPVCQNQGLYMNQFSTEDSAWFCSECKHGKELELSGKCSGKYDYLTPAQVRSILNGNHLTNKLVKDLADAKT